MKTIIATALIFASASFAQAAPIDIEKFRVETVERCNNDQQCVVEETKAVFRIKHLFVPENKDRLIGCAFAYSLTNKQDKGGFVRFLEGCLK